MKRLPWILVALLAVACAAAWLRPHGKQPPEEVRIETRVKTVVKTDTQLISSPMVILWRWVADDTIYIRDTTLHRKEVVYADSNYRAVVSGYLNPRLDSLVLFPKTTYKELTNDIYHPVIVNRKPKRWGIGVQAGYGVPSGWYVGGGISYNLFMW